MGCFAKSGSMLRIIEQAISPNVNIFITRHAMEQASNEGQGLPTRVT